MIKRVCGLALAGAVVVSMGCQPPERRSVEGYQDFADVPVPEPELEPIDFEDDDDWAMDDEPMDWPEDEPADELAWQPADEGGSDFEPEPVEADSGQRVHTVRDGETLWQIAEEYYGSGMRHEDILEANPSIENADRIFAGQEIVIP